MRRVIRGREAVLQRLLQRGLYAPAIEPDAPLQVTDLALLRDAVRHQSQRAMQLAAECLRPISERKPS